MQAVRNVMFMAISKSNKIAEIRQIRRRRHLYALFMSECMCVNVTGERKKAHEAVKHILTYFH
jgi:hypothetical protein